MDERARFAARLPDEEQTVVSHGFGLDPLRVMPAEGFEPPTYGLQNRCTTTVLSRQINNLRDFWMSSRAAYAARDDSLGILM